jgi:hypothetical protein
MQMVKNFLLTLIILFTFNYTLNAQIKSKYSKGFEIGFKEGYCYNRNTYNSPRKACFKRNIKVQKPFKHQCLKGFLVFD